ncbi:TPA: ECF transporter S component [Providencia rettgeri]|uniref:ECF transporter S component n=1 Tax=Providencia TaxID=586 RepID=UPI001BA34DE7|nr:MULTISPECIES: ECF transporter S component [Providencia]EMB5784785.1 ECF transporter S component [Providencia rettgeri]MDK7743556.1 ECF transporter S component [Providencia rettgeri]MDK7756398.1 ECF transporter S component [Providencia rettgeri]HBC7428052.1 ECF transporter S component [Providencia rettgeri]
MAKTSIISSRTLTLIVFSIAINMVIGQLSSMLKLPIFLDSIGTLICALLAGPWVALLSGLLTNLLWGLLSGPIAAAFAPVAMMIGLSAGLLARAGGFRTLPRVVLSGVLITFALMIVAVPIRTYLFAGTTGSGADFFVAYFHAVGDNLLESVAITVLGANIADKVASAIIAWLLVRQLPERVQRNYPNMAKVS